jgi:octaprenyl-diphosphate synthase
MDIKSIQAYLGNDWIAVQERIIGALHSDINLLNATNKSIFSNSGKQLRPLLALFMARLCSGGQTSEASIRYAAAAELLHNATLLHDDVADESSQRRGVPTIMSLMGPSVSVLVGDYWLVKALELILQSAASDVRVIKIFSKTLSDLAEGEMLQLQMAQSGNTTQEDYLRIIYSKTASLFEAACLSAAVSVGADEAMEKAAVDYAVALGVAFQIKDDILDYDGTEAVGKPLGADILEQKITIPLLGALASVDAQEQERVRALIRDIVGHPENRDEIVAFVRANGGLEYAQRELDRYVSQAVEALSVFPEGEEKKVLVRLAHFTAKRDK